jgi:hypothetical protein
MSPERVEGDEYYRWVTVRMPDGTTQRWHTGPEPSMRFGFESGRPSSTMYVEVRNIGKHGVKVAGDVPRHSYHAQLVTSERVNGQPRQRVIAYLGSYQDTPMPANWVGRMHFDFWRTAERRLAEVGVSDTDKARIRAALAKRVPRPTAAEVAAYQGGGVQVPPELVASVAREK